MADDLKIEPETPALEPTRKQLGHPCLPLTVGVENAAQVFGASYRWLRDFAELNSVAIYRPSKGKILIDTAELFAALKKHRVGLAAAAPDPIPVESQVDALRRELGLVRK